MVLRRGNHLRKWRSTLPPFVGLALWTPSLLAIEAVYWDDWTLFRADRVQIIGQFEASGHKLLGQMHVALQSLGPSGYRLINFLLMLGSIVFFDLAMRRVGRISEQAGTVGAFLFASIPLYLSWNTMIMLPVNLAIFLALFSRWLFPEGQKIFSWRGFFSIASMATAMAIYIPVLALVAIFMVIDLWSSNRPSYFKSKIFIQSIASMFIGLCFLGFQQLLVEPEASEGWEGYAKIDVQGSLIAVALLAAFFGIFLLASGFRRPTPIVELALATLMVTISLAPFIAYGKLPPFDEWETRYESLTPIAVCFGVAAVLSSANKHFPSRAWSWGGVFLVLLAAAGTLVASTAYQRDWSKQMAVISAAQESGGLASDLVVITDRSPEDNLFRRQWRDYEAAALIGFALDSFNVYATAHTEEFDYSRYLRALDTKRSFDFLWRDHRVQDSHVPMVIDRYICEGLVVTPECFTVEIGVPIITK